MAKRLSVVVLAVVTLVAAPAKAQAPASSGGPADICQELLAFVKPPAPANPPAATPAAPQQASAVSSPGGATEKPGGAAGAVQQNSGLSGPVTGGPSGSPSDARAAANAASKSPAAAAAAAAAPTKPSPEAVTQAEAAVAANDPMGCRDSIQSIRRAGVTMPSPLLSLGALDPKFYAAR